MFKLDLPPHLPVWQRWLLRACVALPLLMLAANLVAWWRWGLDLPFFDDWRAYNDGDAHSFALARLFEAINNTLSPVGIALDTLALHGLGGNALPYQSLSMLAVLGGLLWLQWSLLGWATKNRAQQVVLFAFCFPMLQSGTYWGEQNMAYQQALPLLFLLTMALCMVRWRGHRRGLTGLSFGLGVLAGLSYISGAIGVLVLGFCWLVVARLERFRLPTALRQRLRSAGTGAMMAGVLASALQIVMTRWVKPRRYNSFMEITWPNEPDFWAFVAGKLGRATGPAFASLPLELVWLVIFLGLFLVALVSSLLALRTRLPQSSRGRRAAVVLLPLAAVVFSYLLLIGPGRAGLRDTMDEGLTAAFLAGYQRFHFFWVTPLFPWLAGSLAFGFYHRRKGSFDAVNTLLAAVLGLFVAAAGARGVFDVASFYRAAGEFRAAELRCIAQNLGSGLPITCSGYEHMSLPDLSRAWAYARDVDASFVRALPMLDRSPFGQTLLDWTGAETFEQGRWKAALMHPDGWIETGTDPQFVFDFADPAQLQRCRILGIEVTLQTNHADVFQVFFRPWGQAGYSEQNSMRRAYVPDRLGRVALNLSVEAAEGFAPTLRIDPADGPARLRLEQLRVACRHWRYP